MTGTPAAFAYHYTARLGWGLIPIPHGQKGPREKGWQLHPVTDPQQARELWRDGMNMGLLHEVSGTCMIDVDHWEYLKQVAAHLGFDLIGLIENAPVKVRGKNGVKPLYRVPVGVVLGYGKLVLPHPTERTDQGRPKFITIVEFRAGPGKQDVLPPSIHPDTGLPYEWVGTPPRSLDDIPELPAELLAFWLRLPEYLERMKAACPWAEAGPAEAPRRRASEQPYQGESVIQAFNARYTPEEMLLEHGYKQRGGRFLSPHSSTGMAAVLIVDGQDAQGAPVRRAISYHGSDEWGGKGGHDAFGLLMTLGHADRLEDALDDARERLGLPRYERPVRPQADPDADPVALWKEHGGEVLHRCLDLLAQGGGHQRSREKYMDMLLALHAAADEGCLVRRGDVTLIEFGGLAALAERMLYRGRLHDLRSALDYLHSLGMIGRVVSTNPDDRYAPLAVEVTADPRHLPILTFQGRLKLQSTSYTTRRRKASGTTKSTLDTTTHTPGDAVVSKRRTPLHDARFVLLWIRRGAASPEEVARLGRMRLQTVRRHLAALEAAGLIVDFRPTVTPEQAAHLIRLEVESDPAYRAARERYLRNALAFGERGRALAERFGAPHLAARRNATVVRARSRLTRLWEGESCAAVFGIGAAA